MNSQYDVSSAEGCSFTDRSHENPTDTSVSRDPLYLFACHLNWHRGGDLASYCELIAALDDHDEGIRAVAEDLLHRTSPQPRHGDPFE